MTARVSAMNRKVISYLGGGSNYSIQYKLYKYNLGIDVILFIHLVNILIREGFK